MTTLDTKMQILHDLYVETGQDEEFQDWLEVHDLGVPLAVLVIQGCAIATEAGVKWIESDYDDLCEYYEVDKYGDYESLDDLVDLSDE